jgi:hypothetical protein
MPAKFDRAPNNLILIAAGITLLSLAMFNAGMAAENHYQGPVVLVATGGIIRDAILGAALLFVALRRSRFAGATAVIVATLLMFVVVASRATAAVAFGTVHVNWWDAIYLAIAAVVVGPLLFPWGLSASKPVLFWMGLTIATIAFLIGSLALLARL